MHHAPRGRTGSLPHLLSLSLLLFATSACERAEEPPALPENEPAPAPEVTAARPLGSVDSALARARAEVGKDADAATIAVHEAAMEILLAAKDAEAETRSDLQDAARELDELAAAIETGSVRAEDELSQTYRQVHEALAEEHRRRARAAWRRNEIEAAGRELDAAARNLEHALRYAGYEADRAGADAVRSARELAARIEAREAWAEQELEEALQRLGDQIERVRPDGESEPR
jgi:hypothetical protein